MKICPKCGTNHEKNGRYCSRSCANSKVFSDESKALKRESNKKYWDSLSEDEKKSNLKALLSPESRAKQKDAMQAMKTTRALRPFAEHGRDAKRQIVIQEQAGKCNKCGLESWMGAPIPLEVDHINGDNLDNRRENLEALCPNCHAMTSTWRGRNKTTNRVSDDELARSLSENQSIRQALIAAGMSPKGGNYDRAKRLIALQKRSQ